MTAPALPPLHDPARLAAVTATGLLDTPAEEPFDRLATLAATLLEAPLAFVTLVDEERSFFKSCIGVNAATASERQTRVSHSFCQYVVASGEPLVVADARSDERTRDNPAVAGMGVAAWAGFPLRSVDGHVLGTFCVVDLRPRTWTDDQLAILRTLAAAATTEIGLRTAVEQERAARLDAERAVATLRSQHAITAALSQAVSPGEVAAVVVDQGLDALGATSGALALLDDDGAQLRLLAAVGWPAAALTRWEHWSVDAALPSAEAARSGTPVWLASAAETRERFPDVGDAAIDREACAALPLTAEARTVGVLELGFPQIHRFDPAEREAATAMGLQIAQALARSRRYEAEREARAAAERSRFRLNFLAEASDRLAASLDYRQTLGTVAELAVGGLAEWCAIHLLDDDGRVQLVSVVARDPNAERTLTELLERFPATLEDPHGAGAALRTGTSQRFADVPDEVLSAVANSEERLTALRGLGLRSGIAVPLKARGRTLGAITVARTSGAPYSAGDLTLAEELARRAALAVDNALRYARERDVAVTLQHSLLPEVLAQPDGMALASRYLPSTIDTEVGGDWYDVIPLPDGKVGLVVGDVMGHGVHAAAIMGQLRTAVRAYALENHPPAALVTRLDRVVQTLGGLQLTTCVYAVYDPQTRTLVITSAGHPPPLVINAAGAAELLGVEPGLPLGVGGCAYTTATVTLPPGTSLLLYTDGLVEGRTRTLGDGLRRLRDAVSAPGLTPHQLCDRVLTALGHGYDNDDDIALLALTTQAASGAPSDEQLAASITLDPVPESARLARDFVSAMLTIWQLEGATDLTALLVSELVTNAVRHAGTAVELTVTADASRLRIDVVDGSLLCPTVRYVEADQAEGGRGMVLVDALAADWGCEQLAASKRIWADVALDADAVA